MSQPATLDALLGQAYRAAMSGDGGLTALRQALTEDETLRAEARQRLSVTPALDPRRDHISSTIRSLLTRALDGLEH